MKLTTIASLILAFYAVPLLAQEKKDDHKDDDHAEHAHAKEPKTPFVNTNKIAFTNFTQKASYVIGLQAASSALMQGEDMLDREMALRGFSDVLAERMPAVSPFEAEEVLKEFERAFRKHQQAKTERDAAENKTKGEAFLAENAKKEGVVTTPSGLQYKILAPGKGKPPTEEDRVQIHFKTRTIAGVEFGNSYKHKTPPVTPLKNLPKGIQEALLQMKPGEKRELFVRSDLAYGEREVGKDVGPNSTIIFELEFVGVEPEPDKEARK
jgi:FKBP-type peptidyl-prolyl cis-trans isomerase